MAAPTVVCRLRLLRQFSRNYAHLRAPFAATLQSFDVHLPQTRLVASSAHADGPIEGALDNNGCHLGDMSPPSPTANTQLEAKTIPISPERAQQEMLLLKSPDQPANARILKVAIVGSPNAGKSTLINSLIGQRICSVSSKVHTTRSNALGVLTGDNTQIVLLDTPGMVNHKQGRKHHLARSLLIDPKNSLDEADLALVLVDASNNWTRSALSRELLMSLHLHPGISSILVLNKVDTISNKQELFSLTAQLTEGRIGGCQFTVDGRAARHLGKVETRALLSHKYRPGPGLAGQPESSGALRTDAENAGRGGSGPDATVAAESLAGGDVVATNHPEGRGSSPCGSPASLADDCSHPAIQSDYDVGESCSTLASQDSMSAPADASNPSSAGSPPTDTDTAELSPTLREYVSSLERFSSGTKGGAVASEPPPSSEDRSPTATADDTRAEKERRRELLRTLERGSGGWGGFEAVFMVSARDGEGVADVKEHLVGKAVPGDWLYHQDVVTNLSPEEILVEAIREKLLEYLPQEVPYNISQKNDTWIMDENGRLRIVQKVICHKKSHVKLLKKNVALIAREAEQSLMSAFQRDVHLTVGIKLR